MIQIREDLHRQLDELTPAEIAQVEQLLERLRAERQARRERYERALEQIDPREEQALAEEWLDGEGPWPAY